MKLGMSRWACVWVVLVGLVLTSACSKESEPKPEPKAETPEKKDAKPKKTKKAKACPEAFNQAEGFAKLKTLTCTCPKGEIKGSVWGNSVYTSDSSVCLAARHAGVIEDGGEVKARKSAGCGAYEGAKRNDVVSSTWGSFADSFHFPEESDGACPMVDLCPSTFAGMSGYDAKAKNKLDCICSKEQAGAGGSVWGSDMYTSDSSVCASALHAGEISKKGGKVKARSTKGCKAYKGSERNGVKTTDWGSYELSFYFPDTTGKPECAE